MHRAKMCLFLFTATLICTPPSQGLHADERGFFSAWSFQLPDGNPAWLKVSRAQGVTEGSSPVQASLLWSVGSARPVSGLQIANGTLTFQRKLSWKPGGGKITKKIVGPFVGKLDSNDQLLLTVEQITLSDPSQEPSADSREVLQLRGDRIPPPPAAPDLSKIQFGDPIMLFNGRNLDGWKLSRPSKRNGWSVVDAVMVNQTPKRDFSAYGEFGNLVTEQHFTDFELSLEYNVEAGGNSGVYLRGMYEAQVVDRDSPMQGISGPGAIFGRIKPAMNAGNPGGEWNRYVLTLVDRHISVVLNGEKVIDNVLLEGCTGGGLSSNDTRPGPIFLQGDHTAVRYRNIALRPRIK